MAGPPALLRPWWKPLAVLAVWTLCGLAFAGQHYLTSAKVGRPVGWSLAITSSLADWYLFAALSLPAVWLARHFNLAGPHWRLRVALHVVAGAVFSLVWILARTVLAQAVVPLRTGEVRFAEVLRHVLVATFFFNMLVYWVAVTGVHALDYYRSFRERELRVLELEKRLTTARLDALQMQLNPHFLFNSLHGISTLMYRDVEAADTMLIRLSELLRHALDRSAQQRVTLRDELSFLDRYLALEQMRFGDRLILRRDVNEALLEALVPNLILQPLVENAIKHGLEPLTRAGTITLRARRGPNGSLHLEVEDDGRGLDAGSAALEGIGTSNTRARLVQLYGPRGHFSLGDVKSGGVLAVVEIPLDIPARAQQLPASEDGAPSSINRG